MPRKPLLIALPVLAVLLIVLLLSAGEGDVDLRGKAQAFILEHGDPSWGPLWDFAVPRVFGGLVDHSFPPRIDGPRQNILGPVPRSSD